MSEIKNGERPGNVTIPMKRHREHLGIPPRERERRLTVIVLGKGHLFSIRNWRVHWYDLQWAIFTYSGPYSIHFSLFQRNPKGTLVEVISTPLLTRTITVSLGRQYRWGEEGRLQLNSGLGLGLGQHALHLPSASEPSSPSLPSPPRPRCPSFLLMIEERTIPP